MAPNAHAHRAAGLRLLALALRGSTTPREISATLAGFAGSQRPILEYFVALCDG